MKTMLMAAVAAVTLGMTGAALAEQASATLTKHSVLARNEQVVPPRRPVYRASRGDVLPSQRPAYLASKGDVLPSQRPAYLA
ncbi:MAG TPA: hypothetical protein VL752_09500 [Acidisoma sp.]|uniref:hypothetical protein n=1 Tax=Acidisoma sp. TaxID=1872115 RepID=UPI002C14D92B|nr:hypothetical protein [Acidisoma sp.]HTI01167.1 hypothetical protein [Acidisoma sp.]